MKDRSEVIAQVLGMILGGLLAAGIVYFAANDIRRATESPRLPATKNPELAAQPGMNGWATLGPLLLLIGMGGTGFVEQKLHQALIHNGQLRWDFGRKELQGIIVGCPFFAFLMTGAMFLPVFICLDRYNILTLFRTLGWIIAAGGLINGLLLPWVLLRITRWTQPNRLRYGAVGVIWLNTLAMICHAYFLFVNPDALHGLVGPKGATAILWVFGLVCLLLLLLSAGEGPAGMWGLFRIDWGYVRERVARYLWAAAALGGLGVNGVILPAWQFRSRLLSMPWRIGYVFTYGPPLLLLIAWLLWHQGRSAAPENRLVARLAALLLLAAAIQLFAFPGVPFLLR